MSPSEVLKSVVIEPIEQECLDRVFNYLISRDNSKPEEHNMFSHTCENKNIRQALANHINGYRSGCHLGSTATRKTRGCREGIAKSWLATGVKFHVGSEKADLLDFLVWNVY